MLRILTTCISLTLILNSLFAQRDTLSNLELEQVQIMGDRAKSIPGSGMYIGFKKIEKLNQPNINHVLRIIPGVNIRDEEGFGLRPNIGLRGTPVNRSAKITLMEDGILIAPAPYADPSAYYFPTFARMQGLEVLKGSSQIKYGPYTIGGAVNLLSTAIPQQFKGFAQVSYGSFNTNQQRIWVGDSKKNLDYVFEFNRLASTGFKELDNGGNTGFDRRDMMGKLRWHTADNAKIPQSVTLKLVSTTEEGNESYLGLTYSDYKANPFRRYAATQKDLLNIRHNHASLSHSINPLNGLSILTSAYYSFTFRDWGRVNTIGGQSINAILADPLAQQSAYQIMTGTANGSIDFQNAARTYFSRGLQSQLNYHYQTKSLGHKVQVGVRYHQDQADRYATRSVYSMTNGTMILTTGGILGNQENQIRNATALASFINYELSWKGFKINPGIRFERIDFEFSNYGNADNARLGSSLKTANNHLNVVLPGIALGYALKTNWNLFAGVHRGFSPPGMPSTTSNTQAKPEYSINYELGTKFEASELNLQFAAFRNNYSNILGADNVSGGGTGSGELFNAGNALIQGVEFSLEYALLRNSNLNSGLNFPITLAYTFTDAKFEETFVNGGGDWGSGLIKKGDKIPFITPHLVTLGLGAETKKLTVSLIGRYTGQTRVTPGQGDQFTPNESTKYADVNAIASFLIIDFSGNYKFSKCFTGFLLLNNLTNNKAIVANLPQGFRPSLPFSATLGLKANF